MKRKIIVLLMAASLLFGNMNITSVAVESVPDVVSEKTLYANVTDYEITLPMDADTQFAHAWWNFYADKPQIVSFFDYIGNYNR